MFHQLALEHVRSGANHVLKHGRRSARGQAVVTDVPSVQVCSGCFVQARVNRRSIRVNANVSVRMLLRSGFDFGIVYVAVAVSKIS